MLRVRHQWAAAAAAWQQQRSLPPLARATQSCYPLLWQLTCGHHGTLKPHPVIGAPAGPIRITHHGAAPAHANACTACCATATANWARSTHGTACKRTAWSTCARHSVAHGAPPCARVLRAQSLVFAGRHGHRHGPWASVTMMWLPQQQQQSTAQPASELHLSSTSNDRAGRMEGAGGAARRRPAGVAAIHTS